MFHQSFDIIVLDTVVTRIDTVQHLTSFRRHVLVDLVKWLLRLEEI